MSAPEAADSDSPARALRRGTLLLALGAFLAMVAIHHPNPGWNVNTRLDLVFAVTQQGVLNIDAFHDTPPHDTMDKAFFGGHHYSDKFFGVSLLAMPLAWILTLVAPNAEFQIVHWLLRCFAVSLPAAFSVALFFRILVRTLVPPRMALALSALGFFGTMWFGYATVFYPYIPGIACLLGAMYLILFPCGDRLTPRQCAFIGALLGYAVLCDPIFGMGCAIVGVSFLLRLLDQGGFWGSRAFAETKGVRSTSKQIAAYFALALVASAIPPALFAAYCYRIFGSFSIPYQYEVLDNFREGMSRGFMGVTAPQLDNLWFLTLHPYRGLFFWSPMLALAVLGCVLGTRNYGKRRLLGWTGLAMLGAYLLFNAGYYMWWGGWCMGPRFLLPAIPFLLFGLAEFIPERRVNREDKKAVPPQWPWRMALAVGALSVALSLPLSLGDPQTPQANQDHVLKEATFGSPLSVPQFHFVRAFYTGGVTLLLPARMDGRVQSGGPAEGALGILLWLVLAGSPIGLAWRALPSKLEAPRLDYPYRTVDGSRQAQVLSL